MPASSQTSRRARLALVAVSAATALSVAACGSSNTASPQSSAANGSGTSPSTSAPPANGHARVSGLIASVSGNAAQVTAQKGNTTVDFTPSTKVTEVTAAALTDVTAGGCVSVRPAHGESQGGQPITAASVRLSPAVDGKCASGAQAAPAPSPSGSPTTAPAKRRGVQGAIASVAGNTINITSTDANGNTEQTAVAVNDQTRYTKQAPGTTQSIAQGQCLNAQGSLDNAGALQATTINLRPARDGKCPGEIGKPGHGHGG